LWVTKPEMQKLSLKAAGIIARREADDRLLFLVQCDKAESFYRFAGGGIEFGETAADAIVREFQEEYDLAVEVGKLCCICENFYPADGHLYHQLGLFHVCQLLEELAINRTLWHKEHDNIKLVWRELGVLRDRTLHPKGIAQHLVHLEEAPLHLVVRHTKFG